MKYEAIVDVKFGLTGTMHVQPAPQIRKIVWRV